MSLVLLIEVELVQSRSRVAVGEVFGVEVHLVAQAIQTAGLIELVPGLDHVVCQRMPLEFLLWILQRKDSSPVEVLEGIRDSLYPVKLLSLPDGSVRVAPRPRDQVLPYICDSLHVIYYYSIYFDL